MLKRILKNILVVNALLCGSSLTWAVEIPTNSAPANASAPAVYTEQKQNFLVTPDQPVFTIQLKSNPTTGYSWYLREYDANLITPIKHTFTKPDKKLMGAAGYEVWTFKVKPAGFVVPQQTTIRLIYARPWDADSSTQLVFRVTTSGK